MPAFKAGDDVKLKQGGSWMKVVGTRTHRGRELVECQWQDVYGAPHKLEYDANDLIKPQPNQLDELVEEMRAEGKLDDEPDELPKPKINVDPDDLKTD